MHSQTIPHSQMIPCSTGVCTLFAIEHAAESKQKSYSANVLISSLPFMMINASVQTVSMLEMEQEII